MNVDKVAYADPDGKCDYGIRVAYIDLCRRLDRFQIRMELILC